MPYISSFALLFHVADFLGPLNIISSRSDGEMLTLLLVCWRTVGAGGGAAAAAHVPAGRAPDQEAH